MAFAIKAVSMAAVLALGTNACAYAHVGSGEVAVVKTPDGVDQNIYGPGDHSIGLYSKVTVYSTRTQGRAEQLEVLASNGLKLTLDASIRYHIIRSDVLALDSELGLDYYDTLIGPILRSQARRVIGKFQPEEIYSTQRDSIERQIREGVEQAIKGRHIILEGVLIRNVTLPESIQAAINNKLEAEQAGLKMKYIMVQAQAAQAQRLMEAKSEADRARVEAQGRSDAARISQQSLADSTRLQAQAAADSKKLDGEAQASYEQAVQKYLTDVFLRWQQIQASQALATSPNAKLIFTGGGTTAPIVDLRGVP